MSINQGALKKDISEIIGCITFNKNSFCIIKYSFDLVICVLYVGTTKFEIFAKTN